MAVPRLYLDHNATAPIHPLVAEAVERAFRELRGNASSVHLEGRKARAIVEDAREQVAALLDADPEEVIFTSGGTEANNLALHGLLKLAPPNAPVGVSAIEHPSVLEPARAWGEPRMVILPAERSGVVNLEMALEYAGRPGAVLAIMLANNEVGTLQPVERVCRELSKGTLIHVDAVQAVGKVPISFRSLGATTLSLSAHKFQGPPGVGALLIRRDIDLPPLLHGGRQEKGKRPGTEPAALIHGLAVALRLACTEWMSQAKELGQLRDYLEEELLRLWPDAYVHGASAPRVYNTTNICFRGLDAQQLLLALDARGVACSTGSACSSGAPEPSHVLLAMGVSEAEARASLRISLGIPANRVFVDEALNRFADAIRAVARA